MTKLRQSMLAVLFLCVGIVVINNTLFSLPETQCGCHYLDAAQTQCNQDCANHGGCLIVSRTTSYCEMTSCVTVFRLICGDGTYYRYEHMEFCSTCAFGD